MQLEFYQYLDRALQHGIVAIATVIQVNGSAPREVGAKMIIEPTGQIMGTIGGGAGEAKVIEAAIALLHRAESSNLSQATSLADSITIDLTGVSQRQTEGVCGGTMQVWIGCWQPSWGRAIAQTLCRRLSHGQSTQLVTPLRANRRPHWSAFRPTEQLTPQLHQPLDQQCNRASALQSKQAPLSFDQNQTPTILEASSEQRWSASDATVSDATFTELIRPDPTLLIVGAGHVGIALAKVANFAGFRIVVQDDRSEMTPPQQSDLTLSDVTFENRAIASVFDDMMAFDELYVALVTRGVPYDIEALSLLFSDAMRLLQQRVRYVGMIGSLKRVRHVFQQLEKAGIASDRLTSVHAPIGLDIGALTPAEIAVSICAELVQVRRA